MFMPCSWPRSRCRLYGTEYHWYILAHQNVRKLNANDYTTSMTGLKFKIAYRRADRDKWDAGERAQRTRLIKVLRQVLHDLEQQQLQEERRPREKALRRNERVAEGDGRPARAKKRTMKKPQLAAV